MEPVILYRLGSGDEEEQLELDNRLKVYSDRTLIPSGSLVIGRYSVLPYYEALEEELIRQGSILINSYAAHSYIENMDWVKDLGSMTPAVYSIEDVPLLKEGPYILKGRVNSRKSQWATHMYANNKKELCEVYERLISDPLIGRQGVVIRPYLSLRRLADKVKGQIPITNEWRTFWLRTNGNLRCISESYYWGTQFWNLYPKGLMDCPYFEEEGRAFASLAASKIRSDVNFFVLDVASVATGEFTDSWAVIEVNDAQMSGIPEGADVYDFYVNILGPRT